VFARAPFRQPLLKSATYRDASNQAEDMQRMPLQFSGPFRPIFSSLSTRTITSRRFEDLARIYEDGVNLCLIERLFPQDIAEFVHNALQDCVNIEVAQTINPRRFDFATLWPQMQHMAGYQAWLDDVSMLALAYCDLLDRVEVGLRLRMLNNAMCPRFHVDRVPARMICSYGGIGTEWLPEHAVDRSKLGLGAKGQADDISGLIVDRTAIRSMPAYAVGLMKGENWEGNENRGLVHRSPTPTAAQPRRLLLTLDML